MRDASDADWAIRLAREADAPAMPAIEREAGRMFARIEGLADIASHPPVTVERLRRYIARGHCLVAVRSGERHGEPVVGFLATEPFGRELHVYEFSVHPDWQGRGIGSTLLRGCKIDARNSGFSALTLTTFGEVPWNAPFYRRNGFIDVARAAHARLAGELAKEAGGGMPEGSRIAMLCPLG